MRITTTVHVALAALTGVSTYGVVAAITIPTSISTRTPATAAVEDLPATAQPSILTEDYRTMIQWAFDRYSDAGLDLGDIGVGVYDDPTVCGDRRGFYRQGDCDITPTALPRRHPGPNGVDSVLHGATQVEADKMIQAIHRFGDAGLELPSLDIYFTEGCQDRFGAWGRFRMTSAAPPWQIEVCTTNVYLHELAHAWDRWNLTDKDRERFLDLRGLDSWRGSDVPWAQRGEEELAQLIARVLGQGVNNHASEEQLTDFDHFEHITGTPPPIVRVIGTDSSPPY